MKKHPGIWITLYGLETIFLISFILHMTDWDIRIINSIIFFWGSMVFYFVIYYHVRWLDKVMGTNKNAKS
jgi:hypothetical protein